MGMKNSVVALSFVLLNVIACSSFDDDEEILCRFDMDGVQFSPLKLDGSLEYLPHMKPDRFKVFTVDGQLNPVDSFEVPVDSLYSGYYSFSIDSSDYEYPYLKIVTEFPLSKKKKMEFSQYAHISTQNVLLKQNLYAALAAGRIETLVRKKKKDFDDAEATALSELGKIFGSSLDDVNKEYYVGRGGASDDGSLRALTPFVYCRHEISDSVFYHDFMEFRKTFAEKGKIDSAFLVRAADDWLSTFEILSDSADYLFASVSRDAVHGLKLMDYSFFEKAYGLNVDWNTDSLVKIKRKSSAFYKRTFINTKYYSTKLNLLKKRWRLRTLFEDSVGACLYDDEKSVMHNDSLYLCRKTSHIWEHVSNRDTLLKYQYGTCNWYDRKTRAAFLNDSLFVCACDEKGNCIWRDEKSAKNYLDDDYLYEVKLDARAVQRFGDCKSDSLNGKVKQLDSVFVQCSKNSWIQTDSLSYYLGSCTKDHVKGEHLGVYYGCRDSVDLGKGHDWMEISAPVYHGDSCNANNANEVLKYDDSYFICDMERCKDSDGFISKICYSAGNWRKLQDDELIAPVLKMDECKRPQVNRKVVYDGKYYECKAGAWQAVKKDSLLPPEKAGHVCDSALFGTVEKHDGAYYSCGETYKWSVLNDLTAAPYEYRDSLGDCDTISNKILHWNEKAEAFFGCILKDGSYKWAEVSFGTTPYTLPPSFDKKKFAGKSIEGPTYEVTVDGVDYSFDIHKVSYTVNYYNLVLKHVRFDNKSYDAYSYNKHLFLHSERGNDSLLLSSIDGKSASFDQFYADWKKSIGSNCKCGGENIEVLDTSVTVLLYNENTFMDYEKAKAFCPKGFHIPDSTEFMKNIKFGTTLLEYRNDSPISFDFTADRYFCSSFDKIYTSLFWTSTEKDDDTQYCYETAVKTVTMDQKSLRIVECPKDLYPMVQTLCVKDE